MNVSDVIIQFAGFLDPKSVNKVDKVFSNLEFFGIKKASASVALQYIALLDSLDIKEITGPLNLMSKEMYRINQVL
jgi:hypothetical protein